MINPIGPALSAIRAFGTKLAVTANNVANIETTGFKKSRALLEEDRPCGVQVTVETVNTPGSPLPVDQDTGQPRETSNVDLAEEIVETTTAQRGFEANLKTLKVWDEMTESIIDILG
ncbi:MAG: hypothetical protein JRI36_10380 [Deltaproteobacteria bacterium]|nr:hypothetical protein [Deltaproteobacteria bacterium]